MFMHPSPFFGSFHRHSPGFPYAGAFPDSGMAPGMMGMMTPPVGGISLGVPYGSLGMYGPHPGMMSHMPQGMLGPGMQAQGGAEVKPAQQSKVPVSRPKAISAHSAPNLPDVRKDVRFARSPRASSKMAPMRE